MSAESALVFNIQGYSIQDGPGIRTTVFLKGCPLRCLWCSNPESQATHWDILHTSSKCVRCYRCVNLCEKHAISMPENPGAEDAYPLIDHSLCAECGNHTCVLGCYEGALEDVGRLMTVDEVMKKVEDDVPFFLKSGGGVTLSGGEPLVYDKFSADLLCECQENYIHTALETSGYAQWDKVKSVVQYTDLVLYDVKHMDSATHKTLTGVPNELILENLEKIRKEMPQVSVVIRVPVIPGANDTDENMEATALFAKKVGVGIVHILAYHRMGMGKYYGLGKEYPLGEEVESPSDERMEAIQKIFQAHGLKCGIGGAGNYT